MKRIAARINTGIITVRTNMLMKTRSRKGMELVQVGILIAIAVGIGLIFREQIGSFVDTTFSDLLGADFKGN